MAWCPQEPPGDPRLLPPPGAQERDGPSLHMEEISPCGRRWLEHSVPALGWSGPCDVSGASPAAGSHSPVEPPSAWLGTPQGGGEGKLGVGCLGFHGPSVACFLPPPLVKRSDGQPSGPSTMYPLYPVVTCLSSHG